MLPALSITTAPWVGPRTDFPSGLSPQPGTVSKVINPQPIRTGWVFSAAEIGSAMLSTIVIVMQIEQFLMIWTPGTEQHDIDSLRLGRELIIGHRLPSDKRRRLKTHPNNRCLVL